MAGPRVYPVAMKRASSQLPTVSRRQKRAVILAVKPVLQQSAADQSHGVRVTYNVGPTGHQAHLDDSIPYGVIVEDID